MIRIRFNGYDLSSYQSGCTPRIVFLNDGAKIGIFLISASCRSKIVGLFHFIAVKHYLSSKTLLAEIKSYQLYINYLSY